MHCVPRQNCREPRRARGRRRPALVTAGALVVGFALAACGGSPSTPRVDAGPATTALAGRSAGSGTPATGLVAYSSCMRSHGVPNFPDPSGGGGIPKPAVVSAFQEVSNSQAESAQNDCRHLLPPGGSLSGQAVRPVTAQQQQDYLIAAACMRSHGVTDFPDPTFSGGNVTFPIPSGIDTNSRQFDQARRICERFIPVGLPYSRSKRTTR
jgi:hypothetical protein